MPSAPHSEAEEEKEEGEEKSLIQPVASVAIPLILSLTLCVTDDDKSWADIGGIL